MKISGDVDHFFQALSAFKGVVKQKHTKLHIAEKQHHDLCEVLRDNLSTLKQENNDSSPFYHQINPLIHTIEKSVTYLNTHHEGLQRSISLQANHQDKLILLVFGKVNSGKSSFSNYLVELFKHALNTEQVEYFYFKDGEKCTMSTPFKEGSTETTAQIQGVEIGNVILLDSPGLHSVTEENSALTQQYQQFPLNG